MTTMPYIFIRTITTAYNPSAEQQVKSAIQKILHDAGVHDIRFSSYSAYWKIPECGELICQIQTDLPLQTVQRLFANTWQADTADSRRSTIYLPGTSFLWISF